MDSVPYHPSCKTVARHWHAREDRPTVCRWLIRLKRAKRGHHTVILKLSPGYIDPIPVGSRSYRTPGARHPRLGCTPAIGRRIIFLDDVSIGGNADEGSTGSAADHIDLTADHAHAGVIARCGHRRPRTPTIGCWIVLFHGPDCYVRSGWMHDRFLCARCSSGSADDVDFPGDHCSHWRAPFGRHGRESLPTVGRRIILPDVVDRDPSRWAGCGRNETAEGVNLAVQFGHRDVMRGERHRFFLCPLIGSGIIFVDKSSRLPARRKPSHDVHLATSSHPK